MLSVDRNVVMRRTCVYLLLQEPSLKFERLRVVIRKFRGFLLSLHMSVKEFFEADRDHSVTEAPQITANTCSSKETAEPLNTCIDH